MEVRIIIPILGEFSSAYQQASAASLYPAKCPSTREHFRRQLRLDSNGPRHV